MRLSGRMAEKSGPRDTTSDKGTTQDLRTPAQWIISLAPPPLTEGAWE